MSESRKAPSASKEQRSKLEEFQKKLKEIEDKLALIENAKVDLTRFQAMVALITHFKGQIALENQANRPGISEGTANSFLKMLEIDPFKDQYSNLLNTAAHVILRKNDKKHYVLLDKDTAQERLKGKMPGTFLLRPRTAGLGLVMDYVKKDGTVGDILYQLDSATNTWKTGQPPNEQSLDITIQTLTQTQPQTQPQVQTKIQISLRVYADFDGTLTGLGGKELFDDVQYSNWFTSPPQTQAKFEEFYRHYRSQDSRLKLSPGALNFIIAMLKKDDAEFYIISRNYKEYILAVLNVELSDKVKNKEITQNEKDSYIKKLQDKIYDRQEMANKQNCEEKYVQKNVMVTKLESDSTTQAMATYVYDDSKPDFDAMVNACEQGNRQVVKNKEMGNQPVGKFNWAAEQQNLGLSQKLPYIPPKVDAKDLDKDGRLISKDTVKQMLADQDIKGMKNCRIKKRKGPFDFNIDRLFGRRFNLNYSVFKMDNQYYAIYKGKKQGKALGSGGFGTVKLAQNIETGEWVALKIMKAKGEIPVEKKNYIEREKTYIQNELAMAHKAGMGEGSAKYIVRQDTGGSYQIEFVMKLAPGQSLDDFNRDLTISKLEKTEAGLEVMKVFCNLFNEKNIIHRDIKPDNIHYDFVTKKVTIIDFGFAMDAPVDKKFGVKGYRCGTPEFMCPSIHGEPGTKPFYSEATEIYALGVTLAEVLLGPGCLRRKKQGNQVTYDPMEVKTTYSQTTQAKMILINEMMNADLSRRPTMQVVCRRLEQILQAEQVLQWLNQVEKEINNRFKPTIMSHDKEGKTKILNNIKNKINEYKVNPFKVSKEEVVVQINNLLLDYKKANETVYRINSEKAALEKVQPPTPTPTRRN